MARSIDIKPRCLAANELADVVSVWSRMLVLTK